MYYQIYSKSYDYFFCNAQLLNLTIAVIVCPLSVAYMCSFINTTSCECLFFSGKSVVILDAAVLLEAGWDEMCHEIWVSVIPKPEVILMCPLHSFINMRLNATKPTPYGVLVTINMNHLRCQIVQE